MCDLHYLIWNVYLHALQVIDLYKTFANLSDLMECPKRQDYSKDVHYYKKIEKVSNVLKKDALWNSRLRATIARVILNYKLVHS